jgi:hypothetical protein
LFSWINQRWPQPSPVHCRLSGHSPRPERVRSPPALGTAPCQTEPLGPARAQPEPSPSPTRAQLGPARLSSSAQLGSARSRASPQPAQRDSGRVRRRLCDNPRVGLESGRRPCGRRSPAPLLHLPPRAPAQPTPPAALARRLRALRPCHGACAGEQTRARPVRRAALLWTPSPFLRGHQALLMTQSRGERTIDAVALRGSLVRLRGVVDFIYGALPLGELSGAFPSFFERRRIHDVRVGRSKSPPCQRPGLRQSTPAKSRLASPRRRQGRFRCPCSRRRRRALLAPAMPGPALSRTFCPTPRLGRQVLLLRRRTTGRCSPHVGNDEGN